MYERDLTRGLMQDIVAVSILLNLSRTRTWVWHSLAWQDPFAPRTFYLPPPATDTERRSGGASKIGRRHNTHWYVTLRRRVIILNGQRIDTFHL